MGFGMYSRMRSDDRVWFGGECRQSSTRAIGGGVGLNVIQGARIAGAFPIIAVDVLPKRLEMATYFGATHTIMGDKGDLSLQSVTQKVRALTDQRVLMLPLRLPPIQLWAKHPYAWCGMGVRLFK